MIILPDPHLWAKSSQIQCSSILCTCTQYGASMRLYCNALNLPFHTKWARFHTEVHIEAPMDQGAIDASQTQELISLKSTIAITNPETYPGQLRFYTIAPIVVNS